MLLYCPLTTARKLKPPKLKPAQRCRSQTSSPTWSPSTGRTNPAATSEHVQKTSCGGCYKRRRTIQTWTTTTSNLVDDGYAWRKYGQKSMLNATFPRSYYRCTHKHDQGCQATKQVQRTDEDPPVYQITYHGNHSCRDPPKAPHIIPDHHHNTTLEKLPNVDHGEETEASETSPFKDILSHSVSFNGSNQSSGNAGARSEVKLRRGCYKRRNTTEIWTTTTSNLVDDGYAWRKYGQKSMPNATFPRSYYRCTHKFDQGCQATKQVQRTDEDPKIYQITYHGNHSCRDPPKAPHIILESTIPNDGPTHYPNSELKYVLPSFPTFPLVKQKYSHNQHELKPSLNHNQSTPIQLSDSMVFDSSWAMPALSSGSDHSDRIYSLGHNLELVDGLSSSCGDERITGSTTNHRDLHDAALLPLLNMDTDIRTASPQPIALPDDGEIVQLESSEQKSLVDFDATNNKAYHSGILMSSEKKNTIEACKGWWESLIQRTEKDMGEGLNEECLTKRALSLDDSTEQNSVDPRRGRGRFHSMERKQPATFAELGTDPEYEGIVFDLLKFVREKEFYKRVGKAWKRGYLLYDPSFTNRSSLMAYMSNRLEFDIHDLDLTGLSSIEELMNMLVSIRNHSSIAIKDFDHWVGMFPNVKSELTLSGLLEIIHGLLSSCGDERIIIFTTNHNHIDRVDAALLRRLNIDIYIHTSSAQPIAVPDGGEIVQLDTYEQKPLEDFDATNSRAYQSDVFVSNSEEKSTTEASRRQCMLESVCLVRAYQSGPIGLNSEKKDLGEGLNRECLTKSVVKLDDLSRQKSLPDVEATKNKAHLFRAYQKGFTVSLSENKRRGEALKRKCITKSILGLEDLQQHSGGRCDDAAKNFGAIHDQGIHTTDSLAWKSFKVVETLLNREQPIDCVPLFSIVRLTLEGWVQQEKSPNLPRVLQINIVEQKVAKLPICSEGLTAESASSSSWLIGLPDGRHILVLDPLEQSTKNVAHAAWVDQCSPYVFLPEKKMVRKTLNRKCKTMSVIFEIHQQHFGKRCEGSANCFRVTSIGRKHGTNRLSTVKRIHKQRGIHQWPFRQKWATRKGYSAGDKRPFEASILSMNEKLDSRLQYIHTSQCAKEDESGPTVSNSEKRSMREALKQDSLKDLRQHFGARRKDAAKGLCDSLAWKSFEVLDSLSLGKQSNYIRYLARRRTLTHKHCVRLKKSHDLPRGLLSDCSGEMAAQFALGLPDGGHISSLSENKIVRKTLKRESRTMSVLSLEDHQQHVGRTWEDDAKFLGAKRISRQHGTCWWLFKQSPDGRYMLSLSKKKIERKTFKRKCRNTSLLRLEYHQHVNSIWEDAVKSLRAKHIYRQLVIHRVSRAKHIHRQHGFHRWPFQRNWETMKAYSARDKRPAEVLSLSTDGKLVSRLQLVHISWLVKFLPRPSAYRGGEIVGPIALLSSEFAATNNRAHGIRNDQSGSSSASHFEEEIPGEPVDVEGTGSGISLEELQQLFDIKREDAAKILKVSVSTLKRICRQRGIKKWPYQATKKDAKKPPDRHRGMNTTGISNDRRNLSASQEEPLLRGHVSGPIYGTIFTCTDPAPGQPTPIVPHPTGNLLASEEEVLLRGHVSGPIYGTISSCTDPAPSQTTPIVPHPTGNLLASEEEVLLRGHVSGPIYGTISSCTDPAPSQTTPIVPHPTGNLEDQRNLVALPEEPLVSQPTPSIPLAMEDLAYWNALFDNSFPEGHASGSLDCTVPACSNPALSQTMPSNATQMQNMDFVELKATYDDARFGETTVKFHLPPKFETSELKEKVSKILKCELDSFKVEYKDKDEEWILMGCDENVREYLQLLNSLGKRVTKLKITKDPNITNLCETCGSSLTRKRPRHV